MVCIILSLPKDVARPHPLAPPEKSGVLVVITRNGAACHYEDASGQFRGLETDLIDKFAQHYHYQVRWIVATNINQMTSLITQHQAHLIAANIDFSTSQRITLRQGPPYFAETQQIIENTDNAPLTSFSQLIGKRLSVVADTQHTDTLITLQHTFPALRWVAVNNAWDEQLLDHLSHGDIDAALVDSGSFKLARQLYPNLSIGLEVGAESALTWQFPKDVSAILWAQTQQFFQAIKADGELKQLIERYYGNTSQLADADISGFLDKMNHVLPKYRAYFYEAQAVSGIDWRLLAAISYQESHWDPYATSETGVRGMMMMTNDTADKMHVDDRLNARASILGGAKYLAELMSLQSVRLEDPDRIWMALASYNQGQGHLEDARVLAQRRHLNADAWVDVKKTLPCLSGNIHGLKHGYCRGGEAVIFVESIRSYYDILKKYQAPYQPTLLPHDLSK